MDMGKPKPKGIFRFRYTMLYSINGIKSAWKFEESFRQEIFLFLFLTPIAYFIGIDIIDYILLIGSLWFLLIIELINSAIEAAVDRIGLEKNELSKRAKDIGSAAVMLTIFLVIGIWGTILFNNYFL